jgi:hypothetical protein
VPAPFFETPSFDLSEAALMPNPFPRIRPTPAFLLSLALLLIGLFPLPGGWGRSVRLSLRSPEINRADREQSAGGYYEGLIGVGDGRDELSMRLLGKPANWANIHQIDAIRNLTMDPLQFELKPNIERTLFGRRFSTNAYGLRDRPTTLEKPSGTFRIALLGSSMDMGWGVGTEETYENLLEDWLNAHAGKLGLSRRFEVQNFAVAAYSPLNRLESFERQTLTFDPDMVIYSATLLDVRLLEIYLENLLKTRVRPRDPKLREILDGAGLTAADLRLDRNKQFPNKARVKAKIAPILWPMTDAVLGRLASVCRARDLPLVEVLIPRVSDTDESARRAEQVAKHIGIAARHSITMVDLSASYDGQDPATLEIATWDDHPNALGHRVLFKGLAGALVKDQNIYTKLFGVSPSSAGSGIACEKEDLKDEHNL